MPEANSLNEPENVKYATLYQCTEALYGRDMAQTQLLWYLNNMNMESFVKTKLENRIIGLIEASLNSGKIKIKILIVLDLSFNMIYCMSMIFA